MKKFKVFFSWQSDHHKKISHHFLLDAIRDAAKLANKDNLQVSLRESERWEYEVDHDTKNQRGFVDIFDSIKGKIDDSNHFVADLTPVGRTEAGKALPNPNVMIELGYALRTKDHEQITVVANSEYYAGPEDLPFNVRGRRSPIVYSLNDSSKKPLIKDEKTKLSEAMKLDFAVQVKGLGVEVIKEEIADSLDAMKTLFDDKINIAGNNNVIFGNFNGKRKDVYFPNAPFAYIKIGATANSINSIRNSQIDPRHNHIDYNLYEGSTVKTLSQYNSINLSSI